MHEDTRKILENFALKHKVILEEHGECGFGRPCVGFTKGTAYIDFNPLHGENYDRIKELEDERHYEISAPNAYHKHDCLAVLVNDEDYDGALQELAEWVKKLEEIGVEVVEYKTGHTGMQALLTGSTGYALKLNK